VRALVLRWGTDFELAVAPPKVEFARVDHGRGVENFWGNDVVYWAVSSGLRLCLF
jgi:hypothetical protein